ncbi:MAG: hypothetical protein ABL970_06375 [Nitrospira sp.]
MKYRRDISHILRLLGISLGVFLLYQVWIKPTYLSPPTPLPTIEAPAPPAPSSTISALDNFGQPDVPQTRLIDPGDASSAQLSQIREDLDRGNYKKVESTLRTLSKQALKTDQSKHYAAALWNNLGIQQEKFGGIAVSVKAFQQAVKLDPQSAIALINLTQAYWGLRDPALTPEFLQGVIRQAPKDPFPRLALADVFLERGNSRAAAEQLTAVAAQAKIDPNLKTYYQQLTTRVTLTTPTPAQAWRTEPVTPAPPVPLARTLPKEPVATPAAVQTMTEPLPAPPAPQKEAPVKPFVPRTSEHFLVRFDGKETPDIWTQIRSILEYAHQDMSQKFGHTPASPVQVILHTGQNFPAEVGTPAWADSLFDSTSTTIHIPTLGAMEDLALLSRVVRHEFAHALINKKMEGSKQSLPTWLAEGLAIQLAEDPWPDLDDIKEQSSAILIPLPTLQGPWDQIPKTSLAVAYFEAAIASQNLTDRYSMYGVRQVMNGLQAGLSLDAAMQQKLSIPYKEFAHRWEESALSAGLQTH